MTFYPNWNMTFYPIIIEMHLRDLSIKDLFPGYKSPMSNQFQGSSWKAPQEVSHGKLLHVVSYQKLLHVVSTQQLLPGFS